MESANTQKDTHTHTESTNKTCLRQNIQGVAFGEFAMCVSQYFSPRTIFVQQNSFKRGWEKKP